MNKFASFLFLPLIMLACCSCSEKTDSKPVDYTTLDSTWECDWLKFSVNSNWDIDTDFGDDSATACISWSDNDRGYSINGYFYYDDYATKKTVSESKSSWEGTKKWVQEKDDPDYLKDYYIEDAFVKNEQAYIVIASNSSNSKEISFYADKLYGSFHFLSFDGESYSIEDITMKMIDSLEFYDI